MPISGGNTENVNWEGNEGNHISYLVLHFKYYDTNGSKGVVPDV